MAILITDMCTGIKNVVELATGVERAYDYDEMPEAVGNADTPALVVYFQALEEDPTNETSGSTFNHKVRQRNWVFHVDVLAAQRNHLNENNEVMCDMADAIIDALETQDDFPFFGVAGAQQFKFIADRVVINLGGVDFYGIRFIITVRSF